VLNQALATYAGGDRDNYAGSKDSEHDPGGASAGLADIGGASGAEPMQH
jgi:hypothetical protein